MHAAAVLLPRDFIAGMDLQKLRLPRTFLLLALLQALLVNVFYVGPGFNDDYMYIDFAMSLLDQGRFGEQAMAVRNAIVAPLAAAFAVFGVTPLAVHVLMTVLNVAAVGVIYLLGVQCFDAGTAVLACVAYMVFPLAAEFSTQIVADLPALIFTGLAVWLFLRAGLPRLTEDRSAVRQYFVAGLLLGLGYLAKTTAVLLFLLPFVEGVAMLLRKRRISRKGLAAVAGFLVIWTVEGLLFYRQFGDFLYHYHAEHEYYCNDFFIEHGRNGRLEIYPQLMFLFDTWRETYPFGIFMHLVVPALLWALAAGGSRVRVLCGWWLIMFVYHQFGSMSLTDYVLVDRQARYLLILAVPTVLLDAALLLRLCRARWKIVRWGGALLIAGLLLSGAGYSYYDVRFEQTAVADYRTIWEIVQRLPKDVPIFCDSGLMVRLNFLDNYRSPSRVYRRIERHITCDDVRGAFVIFNSVRFIGERNMLSAFDACLENAELVATIENPAQLGSFRMYDPQIYYFPDRPVAASTPPPPPTAVVHAADAVNLVNVYLDERAFGTPETKLLLPGTSDGERAEFLLNVPERGTYWIVSRYAAGDSRAVALAIDGAPFGARAMERTTGGWRADNVKSVREGATELSAGEHRLTVAVPQGQMIPHIEGFEIVRKPAVTIPGGSAVPGGAQ